MFILDCAHLLIEVFVEHYLTLYSKIYVCGRIGFFLLQWKMLTECHILLETFV
jgi:hypothetical protein